MSWGRRRSDNQAYPKSKIALTEFQTSRPFTATYNSARASGIGKRTFGNAWKADDFNQTYPRLTKEFGERIEQNLWKDMRYLIEKTRADGLEHGFVIYRDGTISNELKGNSGHIKIPPSSPKQVIGLFHTHPHAQEGDNHRYFSDGDLRVMGRDGMRFQCLGYYADGLYVVKCASAPYGKQELVKKYEGYYKTLRDARVMKHPQYDEILKKGTKEIIEMGKELSDHYVFQV